MTWIILTRRTFVSPHYWREHGHFSRPEQQLRRPFQTQGPKRGVQTDVNVGHTYPTETRGQGRGDHGGEAVTLAPIHVLVTKPHQGREF